MKTFCNLKCSVTPHSSLNTSKGIVRCPALSKVTLEHIVEIGLIQVKVDVPNTKTSVVDLLYAATELNSEHCASGQCDKPAKCVNCSGDHPANSKQCPQWEKEKQILKIKCEQNISFPEA